MQGTSESMPWLANLVDGSDESLNLLPVQCLCEFLLLMQNPNQTTGEDVDLKSAPKQVRVALLSCVMLHQNIEIAWFL